MKLSDYIIDHISSLGTKHIFLVTGGAIAHVVDSLGRRAKNKKDIDYIAVQHEQAGAMAAEAYSRLRPDLGVVLVTSGPGATNLTTGMCGCWFDSIPTLFISGQVTTTETIDAADSDPRQVGFQETDIVEMVKPITKFAHRVTDPSEIKYFLDKAVYLAKEGRPGPVLLDIPVDVQVADIEPEKLKSFNPEKEKVGTSSDSDTVIEEKIGQVTNLIKKSERPIILFGGGIKLARAEKEAIRFAEELGYPIAVSWSGFDILPHNHPQFIGHIGVYGSRGANFAIQNSDLLISLGSRLDTRQTGGRIDTFARAAKKVMVDIDSNEISKGRGLSIDIGINSDVKKFLHSFLPKLSSVEKPDISAWVRKTQEWKVKYPAVLESHFNPQTKISAYAFLKTLSDALGSNEVIIADEGGNLVWAMQSFEIKEEQKMISTFGNSPMGYALPAAIGASIALDNKSIICIDGDGGFQPNIQELQTVKHYNLPIKMFIMNNRSMGIIKQFQDLYFDSFYCASSPKGGYTCPDFVRVAKSYGIKAFSIHKFDEIENGIKKALAHEGPILCDVLIDKTQKLEPKLEFGRPLEDMSPYLDRKEFFENMIIEPLPECKEIPKKTSWQTLEKSE